MSKYNRAERFLSKVLGNAPIVKRVGKLAYQRLNYHIHKKTYKFQAISSLSTIPFNGEFFFGYYDKSPISPDNKGILFHAANLDTRRKPTASIPLDIKIYYPQTGNIETLGQTNAYNWQQGSRLQWLSSDKIIFNIYDGEFKSRLVELNSKNSRIINTPIYDCFEDKYALTVNFERLHALRPDYGYRNKGKLSADSLRALDDDGIFYVDLHTGNTQLLVPLERLRRLGAPKPKSALDKVNHIMISPDGFKFIFLHRYIVRGKRFDRLMMCDCSGKNLKILSDSGMVSHCNWLDNNKVIAYMTGYKGDKYYIIDTATSEMLPLGDGVIDRFGDGHPSAFGSKVVFDTYPDKSRMKQLFLYDIKTTELELVGEFFESLAYHGETRCDLHPKLSFDGKMVFFDSVHEGKRKLYWIEL